MEGFTTKKQPFTTVWKMHTAGDAQWYPAQVPGTVYTDLLRNGQMEDPFWKDNEYKALDLMEKDYEYETVFEGVEAQAGEKQWLRFEGLDTICDVYLNEEKIGNTYNMHRTWEFDVTGKVKTGENALRVYFHSPLEYIKEAYEKQPTHGSEDAMDGFVHIRKAHCMFGWDWGAHLPDAGIFRPVYLLTMTEGRIDSVYIRLEHEEEKVTLKLDVSRNPKEDLRKEIPVGKEADGYTYEVTVKAPEGTEIIAKDSPEALVIEQPKRWWPNGVGEQPLYEVTVTLAKDGQPVDSWTRKIGLRTMTMDIHPDEWGESFAHQVNGKDIFAMGADYIPEDHLLGRVTPETTRKLLEQCKAANFNAVRVWGGGYYPEDWFYDLCDELGLMVWQDFMFACAVYDLTPDFEANIREEFIDNVKRLRHHASLGLWCGNNEMEMFVKQGEWVTSTLSRLSSLSKSPPSQISP